MRSLDDDWYVVLEVFEQSADDTTGASARDPVVQVMPFRGGLGGPVRELGLDPDGDEVIVPALAMLVEGEGRALLIGCVSIRRAAVSVTGSQVTLAITGPAPLRLQVDGADLGVGPDHARDLAALGATAARSVLGIVELSGEASAVPVWTHPGGVQAWLHRQARRRRSKQLDKQRRRYREDRALGDDVFVNPYTFVPMPERVLRGRPRGHAGLGDDGLSGWFDVTWRFASDYLLPQDAPPLDPAGDVLEVPGSSVKGAVRSVHEVLADGCLRVFDDESLPVHRESAVQHAEWTLSVVSAVDETAGAVTAVEPCDAVVWIEAGQLHRAIAGTDLRSGSRVTIGGSASVDAITMPQDPPTRRRVRDDVPLVALAAGAPATGTEWVLHVTDANARNRERPYYVAAGHLRSGTRMVSDTGWELFQRLCAGSTDGPAPQSSVDRTGAAVGPGHADWPGERVEFNDRQIGYRRRADGWLAVGDTVWVRRGAGRVGELKLALLWRTEGKHPTGARVGASPEERATGPTTSPLPCVDPESLCPTCAVFGSADTQGRRKNAEQRSYASHLRFGPLRSVVDSTTSPAREAPVTSAQVDLPPLSSPRPSSGMFYLSHAGIDSEQLEVEIGKPPKATWGSSLDAGAPRRLAGRKFYWHGLGPQLEFPRQRRRPGQAATQCRTGQVVAAGTVLRGRVWFDNLDKLQLGLLLAAVEPALVLSDLDGGQTDGQNHAVTQARTFANHLGGGKPLGYGTAVPKIDRTVLVVHTAASRYQAQPAPVVALAELASEVRRLRCDGDPADAPESWYALASVLAQGRVPPERIWYPPAALWSRRVTGPPGAPAFNETFDESYTFFQIYRGGGMGASQPVQPLPLAGDVDQSLPIATKGGGAGP